jgi:hypothetical protein
MVGIELASETLLLVQVHRSHHAWDQAPLRHLLILQLL